MTAAEALQNAGWTLTANPLGGVIVGSRTGKPALLASIRPRPGGYHAEIRHPSCLSGEGLDPDPAAALAIATEAARTFHTSITGRL